MATTLRFREHEDFQRAAIHMAIAGALAGLATHVAGLLFPGFGGLGGPWALAVVMAAAAFGAATPAARARVADLAIVVAAIGVVGIAMKLATARGQEASLGAAAFAVVFGALLARGEKGPRFAVTMMAAAGTALVARFVLSSFATSGAMADLPAWVVATIAGGAFAFVGVLGLLPRHVDIGKDRVQDAYDGVKDRLSGEMRDLADRGMSVWQKVAETPAAADGKSVKAFEDSVLRLFDVAKRWQAVEADGARVPADALVERMEGIQAKIDRTSDAIARAQYQRAHDALSEQLRYVKEIGTSRERVIARMHAYVAGMERLRFALINHRSADASRVSTEVQPILEDLDALGKEIDCASEAMGEIEKDQQEPPRPIAQA